MFSSLIYVFCTVLTMSKIQILKGRGCKIIELSNISDCLLGWLPGSASANIHVVHNKDVFIWQFFFWVFDKWISWRKNYSSYCFLYPCGKMTVITYFNNWMSHFFEYFETYSLYEEWSESSTKRQWHRKLLSFNGYKILEFWSIGRPTKEKENGFLFSDSSQMWR